MDEDVRIKKHIKNILYNLYIKDADTGGIPDRMLKLLEDSQNVTFKTNLTTLRKYLNVNNDCYNADAMVALCQYYQVDLNEILYINPNKEETPSYPEIELTINVCIKIDDELCSGLITLYSDYSAKLELNHFVGDSFSHTTVKEEYFGTYKLLMHSSDTYFLDLLHGPHQAPSSDSSLFKLLDFPNLFCILSARIDDKNNGNVGYIFSLTPKDEIVVYPIFTTYKSTRKFQPMWMECKCSALNSFVIISGERLTDIISNTFMAYKAHDEKYEKIERIVLDAIYYILYNNNIIEQELEPNDNNDIKSYIEVLSKYKLVCFNKQDFFNTISILIPNPLNDECISKVMDRLDIASLKSNHLSNKIILDGEVKL